MADYLNIAGRIRTTANDGVSIEAQEVKDLRKDKFQQEINQETGEHLAQIDLDLDTPSGGVKARLSTLEDQVAFSGEFQAENTPQGIISESGKIATANAVRGAIDVRTGYFLCETAAATAAKTVSATGFVLTNGGALKIKMANVNTAADATLNINSTGAIPLYYDNERASANNTWEAGETVEIYYDGTNFYANNVAGSGGEGVFDVSEKYPTSGVEGGNTYTLEGAIAVLDANLSSNKKKGGMRIQFIQMSDNKYVEYFLNSQTWTIDTKYWEKINVEKKVNELSDVSSLHFKTLDLDDYTWQNGYIAGITTTKKWNTQYGSDTQHIIIPIADIEGADIIYIESGTNTTSWAFLSNYNVVDGASADVVTSGQIDANSKQSIQVPTTAAYLYFFAKSYANIFIPKLVGIKDDLEKEKAERIAAINNVSFSSGQKVNQIAISSSVIEGSAALINGGGLFKRFGDDKVVIDSLFDSTNIDYSVVNLANYDKADGYISFSSGNWAFSTGIQHIVIPVSVFSADKTVNIDAGSKKITACWLSAYNVVEGGTANVIADTRKDLAVNESGYMTVPVTAAYLYIYINPNQNYGLPARISQGQLDKTTDKADIGVLDKGTTYNNSNKKYSSRIGAIYPIKDLNAHFNIKLDNVSLYDTNTITITLLKDFGFTSGYRVATLTDITRDTVYSFDIPAQYKTSVTKYIGVHIQYSTDDTHPQSFKCAAWYDDTLATALMGVEKNENDIASLDTRVTEVEGLVGDSGGSSIDNAIYERRAIVSIAPYFLEKASSPASYNTISDFYLEQKIKKISEMKNSFIFITDTHLFEEGTSTPRNARHSDLLMSYVKKRCGIDVGIFGGDCYDFDSNQYKAAADLTDYVAEFFSVFAKKGMWVQGNHDNNSAAPNSTQTPSEFLITDKEAYLRTVRNIEDVVTFDTAGDAVLEDVMTSWHDIPIYPDRAEWWFKMHYYKDDVASKTRYIVLESGDNSWSAYVFASNNAVLWLQMDFVATALNTIPEGYHAVILFHMFGVCDNSVSYVPTFGVQDVSFMKLLAAYKAHSSVNIDIDDAGNTAPDRVKNFWKAMGDGTNTNRTFDFSNHNGSGNVVAITGHFHVDAIFAGCTVNSTFGVHRVSSHAKTAIDAYSNQEPYAVGDEVVYNDEIYACKTEIATPESFDSSKWVKLLDKDAMPSDTVFALWRNRDCYASRTLPEAMKHIEMTAGTITEQSFDVFTIDGNKLMGTKIGAGEDIELTLT